MLFAGVFMTSLMSCK